MGQDGETQVPRPVGRCTLALCSEAPSQLLFGERHEPASHATADGAGVPGRHRSPVTALGDMNSNFTSDFILS
jgi:hypothetical protein